MTTTTQKIRELLAAGTVGSARHFAEIMGAEVDTVSSVFTRMEKAGLAAVSRYELANSGKKVKVYQGTNLTADESIPVYQFTAPKRGNQIRTDGLTGIRGIVCAVIADAAKDAKRGDREAREWFNSEPYEFYMDFLGLNPEMRPIFMERSA
jgi:hypothetical protein